MKILLVRLSALGDVVHALPAIADIRKAWPQAQIDMAVDERFADIPRLHSAINRVLAIPLKRWKLSRPSLAIWREVLGQIKMLRSERYDVIIDLHGLIKSAVITTLARGQRKVGPGGADCAEWLAKLAYCQRYTIANTTVPADRMRKLTSLALDIPSNGPSNYALKNQWQGQESRQIALIHGTSSAPKCWPEAHWVALGHKLVAAGYKPVFPWGNEEEHLRAKRLAWAIGPQCIIQPRQSIIQWAEQLAACRMVIGLDTGLTHLAAAIGVPCLALFTKTDAKLFIHQTPLLSKTLGGRGNIPEFDNVCTTVFALLAKSAAPRPALHEIL